MELSRLRQELTAALCVRYYNGFSHRVLAGEHCAFHSHPGLELVYHPAGSGVTRTTVPGSPALEFAPGSVVIYGPEVPHDQRMATPGEDFCILVQWRGGAVLWPPVQCLRDMTDSYVVHELHALSHPPASLDEAGRRVLDCRAQALLTALATAAGEQVRRVGLKRGANLVQAACRHVEAHLAAVTRLEDAARPLGISAEYLRHLFPQHTGKSFSAWLTELRVARARELLAQSPLPLKAIARLCGFANERYFCTVFRKAAGLTPGEYRGRAAR